MSAGQINVGFSAPTAAITATTDVGALTVRVPETAKYNVTTSASISDIHVSVCRSTAASRAIMASARTGSITIEPSP